MEKRGLLTTLMVVLLVSLYYGSADVSEDDLFFPDPPPADPLEEFPLEASPEEIPPENLSSQPVPEESWPEEPAAIESPPEEEFFPEEPVEGEPDFIYPSEEPSIAPVHIRTEEEKELSLVDIEKKAGITPNSPWWGVDVTFDRMAMSLLINPSKIEFKHAERIAKGLNVAEERLWEMQIVAAKNDVRALAKASKEYQNIMNKIQNDINSLDEYDQEKSAVAVLRLNQEVQAQEQLLAETQEAITSTIKGGFTEKEQSLFGSAIAGMQSSGQGFQSTFQQKKDRLVIVVEEISSVEQNQVYVPEVPLQPNPGPAIVAPAPSPFTEDEVAAAKLKLAELYSQRDLVFSQAHEKGFVIPSDLQQRIDSLIQEAQLAYNTQQYGNARELAGKASVLLELLEEKIASMA